MGVLLLLQTQQTALAHPCHAFRTPRFCFASTSLRSASATQNQGVRLLQKDFYTGRPSDLIEENLGLAQIIAAEYLNIPGVTLDEVISDAYEALTRAAEGYKPSKGDFEPYAARAIRNALNSLYHKQMRIAKVFPKSLDQSSSTEELPIARLADSRANVVRNVQHRESRGILEEALLVLSPRERLVIERIKLGNSLQEIAVKMGISKQAVHKISRPAMEKLRNRLAQIGYHGLDSSGFLRSFRKKPDLG